MIDRAAAEQLAYEYLSARFVKLQGQLCIAIDKIIERPTFWIFPYNHRKWIEEKDFRYALSGNWPILVEKSSGAVRQLVFQGPLELAIRSEEDMERVERGVERGRT